MGRQHVEGGGDVLDVAALDNAEATFVKSAEPHQP
jgi:hypothetical protein